MIPLAAFLAAATAAKIAWPLFSREPTARLTFLTVHLALAYWYWLPAANVLFVGQLGPENVIPDLQIAREAVWTVLIYQLSAIGALGALVLLFPERFKVAASARLPALALGSLAFVGAGAFLGWSFRTEGIGLWLQLLTGRTSARELIDYYNFSTSIEQSLRALLEVVTVFLALVVLAHASLERQMGRIASVLGVLGITLVVVATGTRSPVLMAIFVVILGRLSGQALPPGPAKRRRAHFALSAIVAAAIPIALTLSIRAAKTGMGDPVLSMVLVNNDMFRELVYVKSQMADFRQGNPVDFLLVPFTYMLPSFLGFVRQIPEHLLAFNGARANIDLILGSGNVFPGLIADNVLVFGSAGPLWFAASIVGFTLALRMLRNIAPIGTAGVAIQVAASGFLFFSFRNVHPGLALVLVWSAAGLWWLRAVQGRAQTARPDANRP